MTLAEEDERSKEIARLREEIRSLRLSETRLRELDKKKDEFLAMLAHELRNPLSAIASSLELVNRPELPSKERNWAQDVMTRQLGQLTRLLDDLLDVSRITSGKIVLQKRAVSMLEMIEQAVKASRPVLDKNHQRVKLNWNLREEIWVEVDPTRLQQIFMNILSNAAKYSVTRSEITIDAEADPASVSVSIRDTGEGIMPEMLPKIFDLFTQDSRTLDRGQGGLGIGLTIVRSLVEMQGGTIVAESAGEGLGSEFTITLPRAEKPPETELFNEPSDQRSRTPVRRVLLVDDNQDAALALSKVLEREGYKTMVLFNSADALIAMNEFRPQVALLDIGLPDMNGYDLVQAMSKLEDGTRATFIAISGYARTEDRNRSAVAGFHHHLVKPVQHEELLKLIAKAGEKNLTEEPRREAASL